MSHAALVLPALVTLNFRCFLGEDRRGAGGCVRGGTGGSGLSGCLVGVRTASPSGLSLVHARLEGGGGVRDTSSSWCSVGG